MSKQSLATGSTIGLLIMQLAIPAWAQAPAETGARDAGPSSPTMAQFTKLQNEVREQRQLIVQMLQAEQQRYDMLLKLIRVQGGATATLPEPIRPPAAVPPPDHGPAGSPDPEPGQPEQARKTGKHDKSERAEKTGTISGRVAVAAADASDVYVFVENVKGAPVRGKTVEIRQENKQFNPRLAVVQAGTNVVFPNMDTVYHNVFSNSPRNSFDLGTSRSGDAVRAVTLTKTGVVEIFCNMHQKMSANVLVVPSPLYAKARADGTFRIDNVPVGSRKVVAWGPRSQSAEQKVDLTAAGAQVTFALKSDDRKAHLNKSGQAYGSYRE